MCLVEKRNGQLGFPKGRADASDADAESTALREWKEETMLPADTLQALSHDRCFVDRWGCHYFFTEWTEGLQCTDPAHSIKSEFVVFIKKK